MQTRSKSDADVTRRLRTRRQHAKIDLRLDSADTHMTVKSSASISPPPPFRRSRSCCHPPPTRSRRDSHALGGGATSNNSGRVNAKKSFLHRSPSPNPPSVDDHHDHDCSGTTTATGCSPTASTGGSPRRQSVRRAVLDKQPKPTTIFRHHLFLEPTLARQAKKRRQKQRELNIFTEKTTGTNDDDISTGQQPAHYHDDDSDDDENDPTHHRGTRLGTYESERGQGQNPTETFEIGSKRTWVVAGLKQRGDSPLPCAAKVPRRKMSAVTPGLDHTIQVATFRPCRDEELPEGAKELIEQADMARQKKKKPKNWPHHHHAHSPCHFLETGLSQTTHPWRESCRSTKVTCGNGASLLLDATKKLNVAHRTKSKLGKQKLDDGSSVTRNNNASMENGLIQKSSDRVVAAILRRRQYTTDFLASAHDISSIYAGIVVLNDLYNGDDFPSSVARIVIQAQAMGIILLSESLTALFAKQKMQDDLKVSRLGARLLVKRLIDHLTEILMGDMSLHPEKMMESGLTTSEVRQVSPMLQGVLDEIRQMFLALSDEVLSMGGDH